MLSSVSRKAVTTLAEAFQRFVEEAPDSPGLICDTIHGAKACLSRDGLMASVLDMAGALIEIGVGPGDPVVLALPTCSEFVALFWAVQLIGATAVPTPPLDGRGNSEKRLAHLNQICALARPRVVLVNPDAVTTGATNPIWPMIAITQLTLCRRSLPARPTPEQLSVMQFTSGSTGSPRGCCLNHEAILANAEAIIERVDARPHDVSVSWLPLYHDMGLMTGIISPVVAGAAAQLRSPNRFLVNPLSWLEDLSSHGRAHTAAPNFALSLVLQRLERRPPGTLRLDNVATIICGAEPISPHLARRFVERLSVFGLKPEVFHAAYGLAEATLMVTSRPLGLSSVVPVEAGIAGDLPAEITSLGRPLPRVEISIVDEAGAARADGEVGEIMIASPSLMTGYHRDPEATAAALQDGRLLTGDLGFVWRGELFVVGRSKDLIIVSGRNIYPADIENSVAEALNLAPSRVAALGTPGAAGTEEVRIVIEAPTGSDLERVRERAVGACFSVCGVVPTVIIVTGSAAIPRTSSGKVQRKALRETMLDTAARHS